MHARDAVADRDDAADFGDVDVDRVAADLLADDLGNLFAFDVHLYAFSDRRSFIFCSWRVTLPSYTVLPIRATIPPTICGSTFVSRTTLRPVALARLASIAFTRLSASGAAVVISARTTFL